jgi:uncharacterized membrane protein YGL010W
MTAFTHRARSVQDLLVQYAAYHRDERNIATHFVGVPLIVLGVSVLLARARFEVMGVSSSAAWVVWALCALWYLSRRGERLLSLAVSLAMGSVVALSHPLAAGTTGTWLAWGALSFGLGWVVQLIGHWYEGKKPAFVDDIVGLLVGPLFVTAEALFALGFNRPLLAEIERGAGPTHLRDLAHPGCASPSARH